MALPSQQARVGLSGPRMSGGRSRRRRGRAKSVLALLVAVGAVGLLVWQWPSLFGSAPESAEAGAPIEDATARADRASQSLVETRGSPLTPAYIERTSPEREATPDGRQTGALQLTMGTPDQRGATPAPDRAVERRAEPEPRVETPAGTNTSQASLGVNPWIRDAMLEAETYLSANQPVEARDVLNRALYDHEAGPTDREALRMRLSELSETLTFSPRAFPRDTTAATYTVRSGDALSAIPRREGLAIDHRLIQRLNRISNPNRIHEGQTLKVLNGPFHAVVDKGAFRLDLYADQTDSRGNRLFIRSFPVGLGEYGTTPVGTWIVRQDGKVENPGWVNPRTGEKFDKLDPDIPIGEHWIGLEGTDPETELLEGYGLHGTNEPTSIGMEQSMGCIRMLKGDIQLLYEMFTNGRSTVLIVE